MVVNSAASGTGQTRPKVGLTPSAGQVMVGGAAEVATPASGAGENSLFLGAREEGGCLAGRRCFPVPCFSASKAALTGVSVSIAVVLKTLNWTF
jgi:hypothetical protein